jgi:hypothetical protein
MTRENWIWPIRIVTILLSAGMVVIGTGSVVEFFATRVRSETSIVTAPVHALQINSTGGDIVVHAGPASGPIRVVSRVTSVFRNGQHTQAVSDGVLKLSGGCSQRWVLDNCTVDFDIEAPPGTKLTTISGSGDVRVIGISGAIDTHSGSGDVRVLRVSGPITIRVSSGDVRGTQMKAGRVRARTGSGDVSLSFDTAPLNVNVKAGSGDLHVVVPQDGASYVVEGKSGSGDRKIEIPQQPNTARVIEANTGSGDVNVSTANPH